MSAGIWNYTISQGYDFSRVLSWKDASGNAIDLTGWNAADSFTVSTGGGPSNTGNFFLFL